MLALIALAGVAVVGMIALRGVKPVFLWTDVLIYLLVLVIAGVVIYSRQHEHLRAPWRRVWRSRAGMAALVVLGAYVLVGLLDSIHFREPLPPVDRSESSGHSVEVLSVFDKLAEPLRLRVEKTYSAPLAAQLYAREMQELPDGTQQRVYPRLQYGGAHLNDPETERSADIVVTASAGLMKGLGIAVLVSLAIVMLLARHYRTTPASALGRIMRAQTAMAWHVVLLTLAIILVGTMVLIELSGKYHVFGTDKVGQDVLYQTLKSIRTGLVIGTLTTLIMLPFAISLGVMAGYFRGWIDDVIQYIYTTLNSIPGVLLIAASILALQVYMANHPEAFETVADRADARLLFLCMILGITSWTGLCRLLRGESLKLRELDYLQAAAAFGVSHARILSRHILPNVMHIVLIIVVLDFSGLVLAEAVLSYVGVGVDPSMISWGNMINSARLEMAREPIVWWSLAAAFVFMFILVLAANVFSDAVRDAFDPRLRAN
ncbi:MAG: peptide/nickel transport system permease protein [Gammaproteobacteria bacterium]|nr:MAG: peptide/nickel transport system permease protein [Gammaproteobacteria bacterium]TND04998.1 MAG: peptide/nickel transport system permease protein [Gammaproteobacteria bacterium]